MSKGTIFLSAVNNTDVVWKIEKSQMMGSLDCRSLGYFHISRNSLQRIMLDKADFLTDRETVEYFNILKEDHNNVMKFAQEAVLKKQQEIDTKRNTKLRDRKSKGKEDYNDSNMSEENDPYPWLDKEDPRRNMTDGECLRKYIDLSDSDITEIEKRNLYKILHKYKEAFSLRDEIGLCQSMEVELELKDESPFFIRPFPIKESDKDIVDKEMRKGCCKEPFPPIMQTTFFLFSLVEVFVRRLLVFLLRPKCALVLGNDCERLCASRPLLGSYVHQESI